MKSSHFKPEYEYSFDEFVDDFDAYVRESESKSDYTPQSYFLTQYSDPKEAHYKLRRFAASILYLQNNLRAFDEFAIRGERQVLVSRPLVAGLWRYYGSIPEEHLRDEPPAELILRLAREETT